MLSLDKTRPVWIEVNLDHLAHNISEVKKVVKEGTLISGVVKADGYGHGSVEIAEILLQNGVDRLAVATLSEARVLRTHYPNTPIMVLGYTPEANAEEIIKNQIIQTVYSMDQAEAFSKKAVELDQDLLIHVKMDTGMSRLGFQPDTTSLKDIKKIAKLPKIIIEGIFTHFAVADEKDKAFTQQQYSKFMVICEELEKEGVPIPIKHVSNSAAIIDLPSMNLNMVRAGIMLYGLYPSEEVNQQQVRLKPIMSLKVKIAHIKDIESGIGISYGLKYTTSRISQVATLPIGYADGFTRMLSGKAEVLINGIRVPVVGRICMDQCMIDVTGIDNLKRGDIVTIFGGDEKDSISVEEIAKKLGTINYEVVCMMGKRIPRVYIRENKVVKIKDELID
ncbi:MAG: alanine racemase [Thermotaleaceae bacterium]